VIHNGLKFITQRHRDAAQAAGCNCIRLAFPSYESMGNSRYYYRTNVFKRICESWKERSYERTRNRIHGRYNATLLNALRCLTLSVELIVCLVETVAGNAHSSRRSSFGFSAHFVIKCIISIEQGSD